MTKSELITRLSQRMNCSLAEAESRLSAVMGAIEEVWKTDDVLTLPGFGKFSVAKRAARKGYDPLRKQEIPVAAKAIPIFKAGPALRLQVNNLLKGRLENTDKMPVA
jgi:DNA-binding protein HU-beta